MKTKQIEIIFDPGLTAIQKQNVISKEIEKIEKEGSFIVGSEPIDKIYVDHIGIRLLIEI